MQAERLGRIDQLHTCPMLLACQIVTSSVAETNSPNMSMSDQDMTEVVVPEFGILQQMALLKACECVSCQGRGLPVRHFNAA